MNKVCFLFLVAEIQRNRVDAMPLVRGGSVSLSLEYVAQMSSTVVANNLYSLHAKCAVLVPTDSTWDCVEESRPAAA